MKYWMNIYQRDETSFSYRFNVRGAGGGGCLGSGPETMRERLLEHLERVPECDIHVFSDRATWPFGVGELEKEELEGLVKELQPKVCCRLLLDE